MTPTGSSSGAAMVRARSSASKSKRAPKRALAGMSSRCRAPTRSRATCGETSPTKPIMPPAATPAAVARLAATTTTTRNRPEPQAERGRRLLAEGERIKRP